MSAYILPYKSTSEAAKVLSKYTGIPLITDTTNNCYSTENTIINWGAGWASQGSWQPHWLNSPNAIMNAVDKRTAFQHFQRFNVPTPLFTTSKETARSWADGRDNYVVCHTRSGGMMGRGIVLCQSAEEMGDAKLYTKHVLHRDEYRIHVFKGRIINVGKKFKDDASADEFIRNWGGWKFSNPQEWPAVVGEAAIRGVNSLGLDFGAVDIGYHPERGATVFEVNTAPGTGHRTITRYAQALCDYLGIDYEEDEE